MEFYVTSSEDGIPSTDTDMFRNITEVIQKLPDHIFNPNDKRWDGCKNQFSCHLICRALAVHFPVSVYDGYFTKGYEHSWLVPRGGASIIDVYPVGGASPFIVSANRMSPWVGLYNKSNDLQPMFKKTAFLSQLEITTQLVGEAIQRLTHGRP